MKIYRKQYEGTTVIGYWDEIRACSFPVPATIPLGVELACAAFLEREALIVLGRAMDLDTGEALPGGVTSTEEHLPPQ